jgi:hypothetical protein
VIAPAPGRRAPRAPRSSTGLKRSGLPAGVARPRSAALARWWSGLDGTRA